MRGDIDGFALMAQGTNGPLFEACMKNPTIRDRFLKRLNELLATTFSAQNTLPMLQAQYEKLQPVLPQYLDMIGRDMDDYNDRMGSLVRAVRNRPTQVLKDCVAYLGLNEAQFNSYFADAIASIEAYGK